MPKSPRALWIALPLAYFLYLNNLAAVGLIGPDEPRYAAVSRAMASSGDWITPRLLGQPWFEKPALLYWVEAIGFRLGLGSEWAARLPVALMAVAFLGFFWWILNREFGCLAAGLSTGILGTSAAWIVSSQIGTTDLPLAATYSAAMLLGLPWVRRRDSSWLPFVAIFLGLAVLAKGPVAVVLAFPLLVPWQRPIWPALGRNVREFLRLRVVFPFLVVALPWYLLVSWANGSTFAEEFLWKHNFERFVSAAAVGHHAQPFWFLAPVLLAMLLPWTPLLPLAARRSIYSDPGRLFLLGWAALWLVFFSSSANILPSYILPMVPAVAALLGYALAEVRDASWWLATCALLLIAFPIAAPMVPMAISTGLSHAPRPQFQGTWVLPLAVAAIAWALARRERRMLALLTVAAGAVAGTVIVKYSTVHEIDRVDSARDIFNKVGDKRDTVCIDWVPRGMQESLDFYFDPPLPKCNEQRRPMWLLQLAGQLPVIAPPKPGR